MTHANKVMDINSTSLMTSGKTYLKKGIKIACLMKLIEKLTKLHSKIVRP